MRHNRTSTASIPKPLRYLASVPLKSFTKLVSPELSTAAPPVGGLSTRRYRRRGSFGHSAPAYLSAYLSPPETLKLCALVLGGLIEWGARRRPNEAGERACVVMIGAVVGSRSKLGLCAVDCLVGYSGKQMQTPIATKQCL
jgi:hypothetical protein